MSFYDQGSEEQAEGQQLTARLKWFNPTKGFGFVSPLDGSADAFLHVSVLHRAGLQQINDDAELMVEVGRGPKGPQVLSIVEVLSEGQAGGRIVAQSDQPRVMAQRSEPRAFQTGSAPAGGAEEQCQGTVKWFKPEKGFGFITMDGTGHDVFVHKTVLQNCGIYGLESGQPVEMRVQTVEKGREATWVSLV